MGYQSEEALEDFRKGKIDEYDAKSIIEREYGRCSCMSISIDRILRDVDYGIRDSWSGRRALDESHGRCRREDEENER